MDRPLPGSALAFLLITFAVTWAFYFAVVAMNSPTVTPVQNVVLLLGTYAPAAVAVGLTARAQGRTGVRALLARLVKWEVAARWYVFAAGFTAALKLTAALIHRVGFGEWPRFGSEAWALIPFAIAISTPFQAGEELGWRGYALPRIAARLGLRPASLLLGVIWAVWHLPLFLLRGAEYHGQSYFAFMIQVTAISVIMAWLYARTRGSLLLVMLLHSGINNSKDIVSSIVPGANRTFTLSASPVGWISLGLLSMVAIACLARMPELDLGDDPPRA